MKRERMIWDKRNSDWVAMYETIGQFESQKTELHHAIQMGLPSSDGKPLKV